MNDKTFNMNAFIEGFQTQFPALPDDTPWNIPSRLAEIVRSKFSTLSSDYDVSGEIAIHKTAQVEPHVIMKGPIIISAGCFIGAHAYLRGGIFIGDRTVIGPGCELKSSVIMNDSALAHFNFVGDSLLGNDVNLEAGSVIANHFNERDDKTIYVFLGGKKTSINVTKFGAVIGDRTKIGANAVLTPGTILQPGTIVPRLMLVDQA